MPLLQSSGKNSLSSQSTCTGRTKEKCVLLRLDFLYLLVREIKHHVYGKRERGKYHVIMSFPPFFFFFFFFAAVNIFHYILCRKFYTILQYLQYILLKVK